jgi:spermidine synthase
MRAHALLAAGAIRRACVAAVVVLASFGASPGAPAESPVDESVRAQLLRHRDGPVAHIETEYNDLFLLKRGPLMAMSTRYKAESYVHSLVNLKDPDDMPAIYTRIMPIGLIYTPAPKRALMIGLGAGSVSTYLARAMPELRIDVVELDPGVINVGRIYFGVRETDQVHIIESDGRVYLNRHKDLYDLILLDAYREVGVPFHLLTKEFYTLVKEHLAPGGVVSANLTGGTRLYVSSLVTLRAVFPSVDVYPEFEAPDEAQGIMVATPTLAPDIDTLEQRAEALQAEYRFRFPLPELLKTRIVNHNADQGQLLTDDFAPVNLYEVAPLKPQRRR